MMANESCKQRNLVENLLTESFLIVESALQLDLNDQTREAIIAYEEALRVLDRVERILNDYGHIEVFKSTGDRYASQVAKLRTQANDRLSLLKENLQKENLELPSYEQIFPNASVARSNEPNEADHEDSNTSDSFDSVDIILKIDEGVRVFLISDCSKPRLTGTNLVAFNDSKTSKVFLASGDWSFNFKSNSLNPVFKTNYGAYIFVNEGSAEENFVGVVLDSISDEDRQTFEKFVRENGELIDENQQNSTSPEMQTTEDDELWTEADEFPINSVLIRGSKYIASTIASGSSYLTQNMQKYFDALVDNSQISDREINPNLLRASGFVRSTSEYAKKISKFTANKVSDLIYSAVSWTTPYLSKGLFGVLKTCNVNDDRSQHVVGNARNTLKNGLTGFAVIVGSLQDASKKLSGFLIENAVYTVDQKYGKQAAELADNALRSAADAGCAVYYARCLNPRTVPRKFVKHMTYKVIIPDKPKS